MKLSDYRGIIVTGKSCFTGSCPKVSGRLFGVADEADILSFEQHDEGTLDLRGRDLSGRDRSSIAPGGV